MSKMYVVLAFDKSKIQVNTTVHQIVDRHSKVEFIYAREDAARQQAALLAEKNPKIPVYIFETTACLETKAPTIIEKKFNSSGELIPV